MGDYDYSRNKILLVGAFHEMVELCEQCNCKIEGIIDNQLKESFLGYKILGKDSNAIDIFKEFADFPIILGSDQPHDRNRLKRFYTKIGYGFMKLVHPLAVVSRLAKIGYGSLIFHSCNISSGVKISEFVKIGVGSNIMHDCKISRFTTVAPNAVILGNVTIGSFCYIGGNATILPNVVIGDNVIVGAGSVVTKNVESNRVIKGNPAQ